MTLRKGVLSGEEGSTVKMHSLPAQLRRKHFDCLAVYRLDSARKMEKEGSRSGADKEHKEALCSLSLSLSLLAISLVPGLKS